MEVGGEKRKRGNRDYKVEEFRFKGDREVDVLGWFFGGGKVGFLLCRDLFGEFI